MSNPIANLTKKEWWVWICSLFVIIASNFLSGNVEVLTLAAASLTMLRSSYYAVGYAANDIILIVLWVLASIHEPRYISVTIIFVIFFFS